MMFWEPSLYNFSSVWWGRRQTPHQGVPVVFSLPFWSQVSRPTGSQQWGLQLWSHFCLNNSGLPRSTLWVAGACCSRMVWTQMVAASYWFFPVGHNFLLWPCHHFYRLQATCCLNYLLSLPYHLDTFFGLLVAPHSRLSNLFNSCELHSLTLPKAASVLIVSQSQDGKITLPFSLHQSWASIPCLSPIGVIFSP